MSEFSCPIVRIRAIEPIEGADRIELAVVGEYRSVIPKRSLLEGDLAVYIPEGSLVPDYLLEEMGLVGKLAGSAHNRVKAVHLRGALSQGLLYVPEPILRIVQNDWPTDQYTVLLQHGALRWAEGENAADPLGIVKWEPPIPSTMSGRVRGLPGYTPHFDVEDFKRYPHILQEGEPVFFTEKTHGSFMAVGYIPASYNTPPQWFTTSKGLSSHDLVFEESSENYQGNIYLQLVRKENLYERIQKAADVLYPNTQITVLGEIFGPGVQDLTYGQTERAFRAFDVLVGRPAEDAYYLSHRIAREFLARAGITPVPTLYDGLFHTEFLPEYASGLESVSGTRAHLREGVVIVPHRERSHPDLGRVKLKYVSKEYLLRKGNTTEFN